MLLLAELSHTLSLRHRLRAAIGRHLICSSSQGPWNECPGLIVCHSWSKTLIGNLFNAFRGLLASFYYKFWPYTV